MKTKIIEFCVDDIMWCNNDGADLPHGLYVEVDAALVANACDTKIENILISIIEGDYGGTIEGLTFYRPYE